MKLVDQVKNILNISSSNLICHVYSSCALKGNASIIFQMLVGLKKVIAQK